jgi:hypothetical protein
MEQDITHQAYELVQRMLDETDGDANKLPEVLQTTYCVYLGQGVIDNGGLEYFYENDFAGQPPYDLIVAAFRRVGAYAVADCIERTANMFPFSAPHLKREARIDWIGSIEDETEHEFHQLSNLACGNESVFPLLDSYLLKYRAFIEDFPTEGL